MRLSWKRQCILVKEQSAPELQLLADTTSGETAHRTPKIGGASANPHLATGPYVGLYSLVLTCSTVAGVYQFYNAL